MRSTSFFQEVKFRVPPTPSTHLHFHDGANPAFQRVVDAGITQ